MGYGKLISKIEDGLLGWKPESRRNFCVHVFFWSAALMVINVGLYVTRIITQEHLILITLILSWLAITLTCADLIATTDVRKENE